MIPPSSTPASRGPNAAIALVGCGAIAAAFHLPALLRHPGLRERLVFVDPDHGRAQALAQSAGAGRVATRVDDIIHEVGGAIIATPHHLHAELSTRFAQEGVHVLCEKPVAATLAELDAIIAAATAGGVHVAVNNNRRLYPSFRRVRELVRSGTLGEIRELHLTLGEKFDWPAASGFYFGRGSGGRGVVADTGAHVLDLLCWWMGGEPTLDSALDDSFGGSEADATLRCHLGSARGTVRLSWLAKLSNRYTIVGSAGSVTGEMYDWRTITVRNRSGKERIERCASAGATINEVGYGLVDSFIAATAGGPAPAVTIHDVRPSISLTERYYAMRSRQPMAWHGMEAEMVR